MVYFFIYLFLEVMISSSIASSIGGLMTFFEIILSAIIGIFILKNFKFSLIDSISQARNGEITQEEFIKTNVGRAIGALLLIIPGFFTDILGIMLQFGLLISVFSKVFSFKNINKRENYSSSFEYQQTYNNNKQKRGNDEIIDVEIIDDSKSIKQ
ncbi:MAG: FxsA family protein [Campylobacterota bacterium]|nr:FxsA family protein [Campylobacterota bacterium]